MEQDGGNIVVVAEFLQPDAELAVPDVVAVAVGVVAVADVGDDHHWEMDQWFHNQAHDASRARRSLCESFRNAGSSFVDCHERCKHNLLLDIGRVDELGLAEPGYL